MSEMQELRDKLCDELKRYSKRDMTAGTLDVVDKLAHTIKNIDRITEDGYSGYDGRRYSRDYRGYSRHGLTDKLRDLMDEAPDEQTRTEIKRLIDKM